MPPSAREAAVSALVTVLDGIAGVEVLRNEELPLGPPGAGGRIVVREASDEPNLDVLEETLGPVSYLLEFSPNAELYVSGADEATRNTRFDALLTALSNALAADRTLGGAVEWAEEDGPQGIVLEGVEGSNQIKAALLPVRLQFTSASRSGK